MKILNDTNLSHYTTMQIGGLAKSVVEIESEDDVIDVVNLANSQHQNLQVIGQGSNIIFTDEVFDGIVVINKIVGFSLDSSSGIATVGAGTIWDDIVLQMTNGGYIGIEAMIAIPGTCGAAPVNNIGAYGQEIKDVLVSLRAYDRKIDSFVDLTNADCHFSYRNSLFKSECYGRYIITSLSLKLKPLGANYTAPQYPALTEYLREKNINHPTPQDVMSSIAAIRHSKLPDPKHLANAGSFFKNPMVSATKLAQMLLKDPDMPHFAQKNGLEKLSAGWLIDKAGLRGYRQNGIWVYDKHALVLVNESAKNFADLQTMIEHIQTIVETKFGVHLEPEPEIIKS